MNDTLVVGVQTEKFDSMFFRVPLNRLHHLFRETILEGPLLTGGRDDMIHRSKGAVRAMHLQSALLQHLKRLGGGNFMNQVQANQQLILS